MKYKITGNVKHNGKTLKKGSIVEFNDDEAKQLLEIGVIVDLENQSSEDKEIEETTNDTGDAPGNTNGEDGQDGGGDGDDDGLDEFKAKELKVVAEKEKVDIKGLRKNADIVAAIRESREENNDGQDGGDGL